VILHLEMFTQRRKVWDGKSQRRLKDVLMVTVDAFFWDQISADEYMCGQRHSSIPFIFILHQICAADMSTNTIFHGTGFKFLDLRAKLEN